MVKNSKYRRKVWETSTLSARIISWILNTDIILNNKYGFMGPSFTLFFTKQFVQDVGTFDEDLGVGSGTIHRAELPFRGVKGFHHGRKNGTFPEGVQASAIEGVPLPGHILAGIPGSIVELQPQAIGLVGVNTGPSDFWVEKSAHSKCLVPYLFCVQPETWSPRQQKVLRVPLTER